MEIHLFVSILKLDHSEQHLLTPIESESFWWFFERAFIILLLIKFSFRSNNGQLYSNGLQKNKSDFDSYKIIKRFFSDSEVLPNDVFQWILLVIHLIQSIISSSNTLEADIRRHFITFYSCDELYIENRLKPSKT